MGRKTCPARLQSPTILPRSAGEIRITHTLLALRPLGRPLTPARRAVGCSRPGARTGCVGCHQVDTHAGRIGKYALRSGAPGAGHERLPPWLGDLSLRTLRLEAGSGVVRAGRIAHGIAQPARVEHAIDAFEDVIIAVRDAPIVRPSSGRRSFFNRPTVPNF